jgi:transcriptional regulator EpsA
VNIAAASDDSGREAEQRDCLLLAIERSIRVCGETDFFSWTQSSLQAAVPHEVLLCASFDLHGRLLDTHVCSPVPLRDGSGAALVQAEDGVLRRVLRTWDGNGRRPLLIDAHTAVGASGPGFSDLLQAHALSNVAAHGTSGATGAVDSFFAFADVRAPLDRRMAHTVEIIVPHLRAAFLRMRRGQVKARSLNRRFALTKREHEILQLMRHGRSNAEIGASLSISPLTVKNHVQKVLRKLGVRNRTQAVALELSRQWPRCD